MEEKDGRKKGIDREQERKMRGKGGTKVLFEYIIKPRLEVPSNKWGMLLSVPLLRPWQGYASKLTG